MIKKIGLLALLVLTVSAFSQENYTTWGASKGVFINTKTTGGAIAGPQFGFPVLVRLSAADSAIFNAALATGADIRFSKLNGTHVPYQIEQWSKADLKAAIWVLVDTIRGNDSAAYLKMYWGKTGVADSSNGAAVFSAANRFKGVWHLSEEAAGVGTAGLYKDATGANNADDSLASTDTTGIIGNGHAFNGTSDYLPTHQFVTDFSYAMWSITVWVKLAGNGGAILSKRAAGNWKSGERCYYFGNQTTAVTVNGLYPQWVGYANLWGIADFTVPSGEWHRLTLTYQNSSGSMAYYLDGVAQNFWENDYSSNNDDLTNAQVLIGKHNNAESKAFFNGSMDEFQISDTARDAEFEMLAFANQKAAQKVVTLGPVPLVGISGHSVTANVASASRLTMRVGSNAPLAFSIRNLNTQTAKISIVDMWGRLVWTKNADLSASGNHEVAWNGLTTSGSHAVAGSYIVWVSMLGANNNAVDMQAQKVTYLP
jgi:hypothetical protein